MANIQEVEVTVKLYVEIKDGGTPWFVPGTSIKKTQFQIGEAVERAVNSNAVCINPDNGREAWRLVGSSVKVQD